MTDEKLTIVEIDWVDSCAVCEVWEFKDDYDDTLTQHKTVGYLLKRDKEKIVVCQSIGPTQYGQIFRIPIGCVKKVRSL